MFFDVSCLAQKQITGIGVYTKNLYLSLKKISDSSIQPIYAPSRWARRRHIENHIFSNVSSSLIVPHLPFEIKLLHFPDHRTQATPSHLRVQTIHDVGMLEDEDFAEKEFSQNFKKRFDKILNNPQIDQFITVSHFSKSRILHFYPHLHGRVKVVHSGSNHLPLSTNRLRLFPWPYLLFTGTLEIRKNVLGLLEGFKLLAERYPDLRLVLIGKEGYGANKIHQAIDQHPYKDRILWKKFVSDSVLADAYRFAEVFVFPSLYEGFGLPILEAMRHRCPVACSSIPSLMEVGGEGIRSFSPTDPVEMAEVIEKIYLNPSERYLLKSMGSRNAEKFNWDITAKKTWDVYMDLLRHRLREGLPFEWEPASYS